MSTSTETIHFSHPTDRPNFTHVAVGPVEVWFSYRTPIAFDTPSTSLVVRQNDWSNTTGRHLNYIDNGRKRDRLPGAEFETAYAAMVEDRGLTMPEVLA